MFIYNKPNLKNLRRTLRKSQTPAERKIWKILKNSQILEQRFLRQYGVENFILDFYCPKIKLAIEIDGGQHNIPEADFLDTQRTRILETHGIKVVRFWNNEIERNIEGVYEKIVREINELQKQ
jgi:very-short-patch-repair endonuclease